MSEVSEISSIVSAGVGVASALGTAISFLWARVELTNRRTKQALKKCEDRESEGRIRHHQQLTVIELLWQEIKRIAPDADVLKRARKLLDAMKHEEGVKQSRDPLDGPN